MLTILESIALQEVIEQTYALDRSLRAVLIEVEQRVKAFPPGTNGDEEDPYLADQAAESLRNDLEIARSVVQSSLGVVMVLLHAHIEYGLKRIFKATRRRELRGVRWVKFLDAYQQVGIDVRSMPEFHVIDSIRMLSNCYKHDAGKPKKAIKLPSGDVAPKKVAVDYSAFNYEELGNSVVKFLKALFSDADNPCCPVGHPAVDIVIEADGSHKITRRQGGFLTRTSDGFDIQVKRRVCVRDDNELRVVGSLIGEAAVLLLPGVAPGVKVKYDLQFVNSRGERSQRLEKERKRDDIASIEVVQP